MSGYENMFDDIALPGVELTVPPIPPRGGASTPATSPVAPAAPAVHDVESSPDDDRETVPDAPGVPEDAGVVSLEAQAEMNARREPTLEEKLEELRFQPQQTAVGSGGAGLVAMPGARVTSDKMVRVEIHKELFDVIKSYVVGASNKTDVLEAFICAWAGDYVPVPDNVRELLPRVKTPSDHLEETTESLLETVRTMQRHLKNQDRSLDVVQVCAMWLVAEKMGLPVSFTSNVNKADFIFPDYERMLRQLSVQVGQYQEAKRRRVGRAVGEQAMRNRNGGK